MMLRRLVGVPTEAISISAAVEAGESQKHVQRQIRILAKWCDLWYDLTNDHKDGITTVFMTAMGIDKCSCKSNGNPRINDARDRDVLVTESSTRAEYGSGIWHVLSVERYNIDRSSRFSNCRSVELSQNPQHLSVIFLKFPFSLFLPKTPNIYESASRITTVRSLASSSLTATR